MLLGNTFDKMKKGLHDEFHDLSFCEGKLVVCSLAMVHSCMSWCLRFYLGILGGCLYFCCK